ncbi:hypothetical protein GCM10010247_67280 [Streptomyces calvus]|nr:hypothetical protein GCM10010247_67280 [Streptomyces calvus]
MRWPRLAGTTIALTRVVSWAEARFTSQRPLSTGATYVLRGLVAAVLVVLSFAVSPPPRTPRKRPCTWPKL